MQNNKASKIRQRATKKREREFVPLSLVKKDYEKMKRRLGPQKLERLRQEVQDDINRKYEETKCKARQGK